VLAGLGLGDPRMAPHTPQEILFAENWEDAEGFKPDIYKDITEGFDLWQAALDEYEIGRADHQGFPYRDYYTSLARLRGCLAGTRYAQAFFSASIDLMAGLGRPVLAQPT
jgi:hypothetical protein